MSTDYPDTFVKRRHAKGCSGSVINRYETIHVDRIGRIGNGGIVTHLYTCNMVFWNACPARVLVTERAVRSIASNALGEDPDREW